MAIEEIAGLGALGAIAGAMIGVMIVVFIGLYIYSAFAWMTIAKKLGEEDIAWLAWVPIANLALLPILAEKEWPWVFILLVPIANIVFMIMWIWKIYERRNYPGALALIPLGAWIPYVGLLAGIGNLVVLGLVAWSDREPAKK